MSLRRISTILLGAIGIALLIFAIWLFSNRPYAAFAAQMFGLGGLAIIAIAVLVYRSTSFLDAIRAIVSWMLILAGIPPIIPALWSMLSRDVLTFILSGTLGLAAGTLGWTLRKPKVPIGIAQRISSGICITFGAGAIAFPILILSIFGTTIAFTNIAPIYVVAGVALIVKGSLLRRPRKTKDN